jgi:hypothetical protein
MNILTLVGLILGTAETIIPIFVHNPKSQQVESVIFTDVNNLYAELGMIQSKPPVSSPTPATPPATVTPIAS